MLLKETLNFRNYKTAFYVVLVYLFFCQLSGLLLIFSPWLMEFLLSFITAPTRDQQLQILKSLWHVVSFVIATIVIFILINRVPQFWHVFKGEKSSLKACIGWGLVGFPLVLIGQILGGTIEHLLGFEAGSDNTANITNDAKTVPLLLIVVIFLGPLLEEIVFRRAILGSLIQSFNFWISSIISAILFSLIHLEIEHFFTYAISGLVFAFLYQKTKRIITSIIAHILLNSFVLIPKIMI